MTRALYLSRVRLRSDASVAALLPLLLTADGEKGQSRHPGHHLVWSLFADGPDRHRDFLWREMEPRGTFLILSARPPMDRHELFELDEPKPFAPMLAAGDRLRFSMRANPVVRRRDSLRGRSVKHDVVMDALRSFQGTRPEYRQVAIREQGVAWLARQAGKAGFAIQPDEIGIDGYRQHQVSAKRAGRSNVVCNAGLRRHFDRARPGQIPGGYRTRFRCSQSLRLRPDAHSEGVNAMTETPGLAPPRPIPIKDRASILFIEKGQLDVLDGAFVVIDRTGVRTHIPVGGLACLMLEPGARISHAAVALAARVGCLLVWIGEAGVRLYSVGQPGGARADRLLHQARLALDPDARLRVVRKMYDMRFGEPAPIRRSVDQLRGIEGARVKRSYEVLARQRCVKWKGRRYDPGEWDGADLPNRCLSQATACLYGLAEAAILAAGYAPAIGFLHTGKPQSFVYDVADVFKFETVVPIAFQVAGEAHQGKQPAISDPMGEVRRGCRDSFRKTGLLNKIIPGIEAMLAAGELEPPPPPDETQPVAIPEEPSGDVGHRG